MTTYLRIAIGLAFYSLAYRIRGKCPAKPANAGTPPVPSKERFLGGS